MEFKEIISLFAVEGDLLEAVPYGEGHINDTYAVTTTVRRYILQRINHSIFKQPENVMRNIHGVTEHLRKKIIRQGGDPLRETLTLIPTLEGQIFLHPNDGNFYRMYLFIEGARTYQTVEKPVHFYNAARSFGRFQQLLADYPAHELTEAIPNFHNTRMRYNTFLQAVGRDPLGRAAEAAGEIAFAKARAGEASVIVDGIEKGTLPLRVTHNDTKLNNIMIDDVTGEGICVIDLDTVMPGSVLYDFGDSLRFGTNPAAEDEKDLSRVYMVRELYEEFTRGFLEVAGESLTPEEIRLLAFSARLMTYECGIRFLTDYLEGDTYFKTHYPGQNLDRTRTQFKLVADMERQSEYMEEVVKKYAKAYLRPGT